MANAALADYLEDLAGCGQLARITAEVDSALEIAEITRRVARQNGPALLFEQVRGRAFAVVTNLLGSETRVCRALEIDSIDAIPSRLNSLIDEHTPRNWFERLRASDDPTGADRFRPKVVKSGLSQQVVCLGRDVDLDTLPLVTQGPSEAAPALPAARIVTHPLTAEHHRASVCRVEATGINRLAVTDGRQTEFWQHWEAYRQAGQQMPVAIVVGGDPAGTVAANMEPPAEVDHYHLTGLLRGKPVELVKCRTHELFVPADADVVLEGYLDPASENGDAANGTSHNGMPREQGAAAIHVSAITHRAHPLVPLVIDAQEFGEARVLLKVRERVLLPALQTIAPGVVDVHLPTLGGLHHYAFVAVRKTYPHQARQVASALWGSAALRSTKFLVLVAGDTDVRNVQAVLSAMGTSADPACDLFFYDGPASSTSAYDAPGALARHCGIDATTKIPGEPGAAAGGHAEVSANPTVAETARPASDGPIEQRVAQRWSEYGLSATWADPL